MARQYVKPDGPKDARIMLVGEAPWKDEVREGRPFAGASGYELTHQLREAGLSRSECFVTNVIRYKPENDITDFILYSRRLGLERGFIPYKGMYVAPFVPEHIADLMEEISSVKPNVIVALGNTPLWALTGKTGISEWRGSQMVADCGRKLVPILHPASVLREYSLHPICVMDFKNRVLPESYTPDYHPPSYSFTIRPTFEQTMSFLTGLLDRLNGTRRVRFSCDIETRRGQVACIGIGTSAREAFCIPLQCVERPEGYWTEEEELAITQLLCEILQHRNAWLVGQNFLYDAQYIFQQLGIIPYVCQDTAVWHHTLFPGLLKRLYFQASLYAEFYCYWKDEGKEWADKKLDEDTLWHYNCLDCVYTYEISEVLTRSVVQMKMEEQAVFQQSLFYPALDMMLRGVRQDTDRRKAFGVQLESAISAKHKHIEETLGHAFNPNSKVQMQRLFYDDFAQRPVISRKTDKPTLDAKALETIAVREPLLRPLISDLQEYRSLNVLQSTFVEAAVDPDGRMRCSYNLTGTETFRWSSSKNAFGRGGNLQNVPSVGSSVNVRSIFVPDPDYFLMDWDLDRADLQVVVWEADDAELKQMLREKVDLHAENAKVLHCARDVAKRWVHGTNYGGSARTMARNCGITVAQSEAMRRRWFSAHPGIAEWHRRTESCLAATRSVSNAFGYRRIYFGRIEALLPEALAWIPQSTVALVINTGLRRIFSELPEVELLLQVHDSVVLQAPHHCIPAIFPEIRRRLEVVVPYRDPLIIPVSGKGSWTSWGECEKLSEG